MAWSWQSVVCVNAMQQLKRLVTLLCQECNYYSQLLKMKGEEWQWIMKPFSLMKLVPWYTSGRRVRLMMELRYICYNIKMLEQECNCDLQQHWTKVKSPYLTSLILPGNAHIISTAQLVHACTLGCTIFAIFTVTNNWSLPCKSVYICGIHYDNVFIYLILVFFLQAAF